MKKTIVVYFLILFCFLSGYAQKPDSLLPRPESPQNPLKELKKDIDALTANPDFANAHIGISVLSIETGEYFYRKNENRNFIPASTQKLLTTAAALEYLGKDFTYSTTMYLDGIIQDNGEFLGNIIIRGTGDPSISKHFYEDPSDIFADWADLLDSMGINSIKGNIIGDDRYFDNIPYGPGWSWDDMSYAYSAQINALNAYDNVVEILLTPGDTIGDFAKYKLFPENNYLRVLNNVKTAPGSKPTSIDLHKELNANLAEISGDISLDTLIPEEISIPVSIHNPTLYFLSLFRKALLDKGIRCRSALIDVEAWNDKINYALLSPAGEHISPPLSQIINLINKKSHNLCADILLKTIAKETTGKGSFENGCSQVNLFAGGAGLSPENFVYADGSGLSRFNLISPSYQTALLSYAYRSGWSDIFMQSLAKPGREGTLEKRMIRSLAENSVSAKTGSMNNVSTICGYIRTRSSEIIAFSIMMNNFTVPISLAHNLQDLICMRLAGFSRKVRGK